MRSTIWILLLSASLLLSACERRASAPGAASAPSPGAVTEKLTIAMMPKLRGIDYFNACQRGAQEAASELNDVDLLYDGPTEAKVDKQVEIIDTWIAQRVKAIAVAADDPVALAPALKRAREAGIAVITYDADAYPGSSGKMRANSSAAATSEEIHPGAETVRQFFVSQCSPDAIAAALTDEMATQAGTAAKTAIVTSSLTAPNQNDWMRRMLIYRRRKYPRMQLLTTQPSEEDEQKAIRVTQDILKAYPDVQGIWGISSVAFPGAAEAVEQQGKKGKVAVVGLSTPSNMAKFVKDGTVKTVILWNPVDLGYLAIYTARAVARGELKPGATQLHAGRLGERSIQGDVVLLGEPMRFTKANIDRFKF